MKTNLREVENRQLAERLDETDMAMYRVLLNDKKNAEQTMQQLQQAQQALLKLQGSEEFLVRLWRVKYSLEGNFEIDDKGNIKRLPTAVAMEQ